MASFNANQLNASDINGGQQFASGNAFTPQNANAIVEGILYLNGKVGSGSSGGGTTVEANPSGTATSTLNKIKIDNTIYSIPQGSSGGSGGGSTIYKHEINLSSDTFTFYSTNGSSIVYANEDEGSYIYIYRQFINTIIGGYIYSNYSSDVYEMKFFEYDADVASFYIPTNEPTYNDILNISVTPI